MATLNELKEELEPYRGTLVIGDFDSVVLLKDVIEGDDDYYWVYVGRIGREIKEYHATCVGGWVPLKGFIPDEKYQRLVCVWNMNHNADNQAI